MEQENNPSLKQPRRASSRLHKHSPPFSNWSLKKQPSATSLQRHPSAPVYPRSLAASSREHLRTKSGAFASSSSSIDQSSSRQSPVLTPTPEFGTASVAYAHGAAAPSSHNNNNNSNNNTPSRNNQSSSRFSLNHNTSDEFIGSPFDTRAMFNAVSSVNQSDQSHHPRRPPLQPSYKSSPEPRSVPTLRQSASFTNTKHWQMDSPVTASASASASATTASSSAEDGHDASKRYSDEPNNPRQGLTRKKTGFSSFVNSMLGSPRSIKISAPENPVHVTHVGYDNETGQFTVCSFFFFFFPSLPSPTKR